MSGPTYPGGGYPTDPNNPYNPGNPNTPTNPSGYPQQPPQPPYGQPPTPSYGTPPEYPAQPPYQPQPSYGQPPEYSQPPAYQPPQPPVQPPAYPPQPTQPPKKSGSRVWLIVGIIAAVLVVACIGGCLALTVGGLKLGQSAVNSAGTQLATAGSGLETQAANAGALVTVTTFCQDVQSQQYSSAYQEFSSTLQQQISQDKFTSDATNFDTSQGQVTSCIPQGAPNFSGSTATITVQVTRTLAPTPDSNGTAAPTQTANATGTITMVEDSSNNWTISNIDTSLNLL